MTTDPHIYEGEHNTLKISPTSDPGVVDVDLVNRAERSGFWMEVPVGKLRSMIAASTTITADDMDGGVTAALIEKEAEESPSVDYEAMWWDAERRAEKAEDRADEAHNLIVALRADLAATEARAEQAEKERDEALRALGEALDSHDETLRDIASGKYAAESRPLGPDAITDEMVDRSHRSLISHHGYGRILRSQVREALTAALTEPPARPDWQDLSDTLRDIDHVVALSIDELAEAAYERGVRVVTEEHTRACDHPVGYCAVRTPRWGEDPEGGAA